MSKPNILFLFSDEHSFRCMGHTDAGLRDDVDTPNFDRLANQGTVYHDTYCQVALCTPSRLCLLTGKEQHNASAWRNESVLLPEHKTLPAAFADAGYRTCLVGKMHFGGTRQFNGFHDRPYGDLTGCTGHQQEPEDGIDRGGMRSRTENAGVTIIPESKLQENVIMNESVAWLREHRHANPDQPWFLMASFSRPHFPLTAPKRFYDRYAGKTAEPFVPATGDAYEHPMSIGMRKGFQTDEIEYDEMMHARACYHACVSYLDELIGDMLNWLERDGFLENTIIVYTSDHGELAGEHGVWWKNSWHEASARIPLIISTPEQRHGDAPAAVEKDPVQLIDMYPTLASLAGIHVPDDLDGVDISGELDPNRFVLSDGLTPRWGEGTEYRMVRWKHYKYIMFRGCDDLLFDLANDPQEQTNLINSSETEYQVVKERILEFLESRTDFDASAEKLAEDAQRCKAFAKPDGMTRMGNCYMFKNGRVVHADDTLYTPTVVTDDPGNFYSDFEG
jgi:choline-sulfatase